MYYLADLPYPCDALEPHIDERTMKIHHDRHHATYVEKLNSALAAADLQDADLIELLQDLAQVPHAQRTAVRNHGGGHLNHTLLWNQLSGKDTLMGPTLHSAVNAAFGSTADLLDRLQEAGAALFGSGWVWLVCNEAGELSILSLANQDNPLSTGLLPVLGIDVWEHAYYLRYQNRRPAYLEAFVQVIDWAHVSERYERLVSAGASALNEELGSASAPTGPAAE